MQTRHSVLIVVFVCIGFLSNTAKSFASSEQERIVAYLSAIQNKDLKAAISVSFDLKKQEKFCEKAYKSEPSFRKQSKISQCITEEPESRIKSQTQYYIKKKVLPKSNLNGFDSVENQPYLQQWRQVPKKPIPKLTNI